MSKIHIGIDVGKNGFIAVINSDIIDFYEIPKIGSEVNLLKLSQLIYELRTFDEGKSMHCVIEQVHAIFGSSAKSTFEFGRISGILESMLVCNSIPYTLVQPKIWQKEMFSGIPLQKKPSSSGKTLKTDTKKMALMAANRLFPNIDFKRTERCKLVDDNKVDALLLAEFSRRKFS